MVRDFQRALREFGGLATAMSRDYVPRSQSRGALDSRDAEQAAVLALLESVEFVGDMDIYGAQRSSFVALLRARVRNAITDAMAQSSFATSGADHNALGADGLDGGLSIDADDFDEDWLADLNESGVDAAALDRVLSVFYSVDNVAGLSRQEKVAVQSYYIDGVGSYAAVAELLGIDPSNARRAVTSGIDKLKFALNSEF